MRDGQAQKEPRKFFIIIITIINIILEKIIPNMNIHLLAVYRNIMC